MVEGLGSRARAQRAAMAAPAEEVRGGRVIFLPGSICFFVKKAFHGYVVLDPTLRV